MVYLPCGVPRGSIVGVFNGEGPPVPIPNTEVKLTSADNTCLETDREDRSMPTQKAATIRLRLFAVYCMVIWAQFSLHFFKSQYTGGKIKKWGTAL